MFDLTDHKEKVKNIWVDICDNEKDAEVMSQIDAIVEMKYLEAEKTSKDLGITFHVEGQSHWEMIGFDDEIFQRVFKKHPDHHLIQWTVNNLGKGYHVETLHHVIQSFKKEFVK